MRRLGMHASVDVIVFGATGFTGRLVAEYLNAAYGVDGEVAWAIAGRNPDKLVEVRDRIGASTALPLRIADASDAASLAALVPRPGSSLPPSVRISAMASRSSRPVRRPAPTTSTCAASRAGW